MILYDKKTGKDEVVFATSSDSNGYPKFLIRKSNQWIWRSAKYYITREERLHTPYTECERVNGAYIK